MGKQRPAGRAKRDTMTMADEKKNKQGEDPYEAHEIEIDSGGPVDWASAFKELEEMEGAAAPAKPQPAPVKPAAETPVPDKASPPTPNGDEAQDIQPAPEGDGLSRYEELCKKKTMAMDPGDFEVFDELSDVLSCVNSALNKLKAWEKKHPYLVAPNILRMWEDNLKETSTVMLREFHQLRNGRQQKQYDKRFVCSKCHAVFMSPLPNGICDECRASEAPRSAPY